LNGFVTRYKRNALTFPLITPDFCFDYFSIQKMTKVLNINIGCLGHIDSGKTSLAKALSTTASTSCFDKCPQSRERGITIDLGFSSVCFELPKHLLDQINQNNHLNEDLKDWLLQLTFVDCPGHSSLIKTIIGGAQIIDLMVLVVDITKGIQTQTAECLVIGEITANKMVVVLNKIDLIPVNKRDVTIDKVFINRSEVRNSMNRLLIFCNRCQNVFKKH